MKLTFPTLALLAVWGLALSACSPAPSGVSVHDPYEPVNRSVHAFNKTLDRAAVRPAGKVAAALPTEITASVTNFADNVSLPGYIVNGVLQGDIGGAGTNAMRFVLNTTVGIMGLFDPADAIGLYEVDTDFGETLHVWGVPEGAYVELPLFGPSNERDAVGRVVDFFIDPLDHWGTQVQSSGSLPSNIADKIISRGRFGDTVDSVLYESADSYAQTRILYLERRRYTLGIVVEEAYEDPYADPYFDPYEDQ